jgi:hypothetical protein
MAFLRLLLGQEACNMKMLRAFGISDSPKTFADSFARCFVLGPRDELPDDEHVSARLFEIYSSDIENSRSIKLASLF